MTEGEGAADDMSAMPCLATRGVSPILRSRRTLSNTEFALLVALARQPECVFTKAELLRHVWGYRSLGRPRTLDSFASRIRRKLQGAGAPRGRYVVCVWGVGYSLIRP